MWNSRTEAKGGHSRKTGAELSPKSWNLIEWLYFTDPKIHSFAKYMYIFNIYLAVLGLSCGTRGLQL